MIHLLALVQNKNWPKTVTASKSLEFEIRWHVKIQVDFDTIMTVLEAPQLDAVACT